MHNLFEPTSVTEIRNRIESLTPDNPRQWGKMTPAQMMAHCSAWFEMAAGLNTPPRSLLGRFVGRMAKKSVLGKKPIPHNMPTEKSLLQIDDRHFARNFTDEQQRLLDWLDRFSAAGPSACTTHPHCFFGPMTPIEWATIGYKHLDHHLQQFSA